MSDTKLDIENIRGQFVILSRKVNNRPLVYLDNAATSQTPARVLDTLEEMYTCHHANVHRGVHSISQEATDRLEHVRHRVALRLGAASDEEIVFTRGTTESVNLVADTYCRLLSPGDEILVTVMEHHSNIVPWQLAARRNGLKIRAAGIRPDGSLDLDTVSAILGEGRVRLVAVCHVSNVLGTVNPVRSIADMAHAAGAVVLVDGAQAAAHMSINVSALGADFYAFSSHKMYGPTGVGVLYGRRELLDRMPPYQGGGEMIAHVDIDHATFADLPFKFEAGTPDFTAVAAFDAAFDFIDSIGIDAMAVHEHALLDEATRLMLDRLPGVRIFGATPDKEPVISFLLDGIHHYDTGMLLDQLGIAVRTGHHCAQPLMTALGIEGCVRASFAVYNTMDEVHAFVDGLVRVQNILKN